MPWSAAVTPGGRGKTYPYYHCGSRKCGFGSVRIHQLHLQFEQLLISTAPSKPSLGLVREVVACVWNTSYDLRLKQEKNLHKQISQSEGQRRKAQDLLLKGTLSESDYRELSEGFATKIAALRAEMSELQVDLNDVEGCVNHCLRLLSNPCGYWSTTDLDSKQRIQRFVFPQGVTYFGGSFGTAETSILFNVLRAENGEKSNLATPTGCQ